MLRNFPSYFGLHNQFYLNYFHSSLKIQLIPHIHSEIFVIPAINVSKENLFTTSHYYII